MEDKNSIIEPCPDFLLGLTRMTYSRGLFNSLRLPATRYCQLASTHCLQRPLNSIRLMSSINQGYEYILISRPEPSVVLVTLNRPQVLNALCAGLLKELNSALEEADQDASVDAMVLTGSSKAFAGASLHSSFGVEC